MFKNLEIFRAAQAMATHASARQATIAQNIANADTPGYKARDITPFAETYRAQNGDFTLRSTRAGHLTGGRSSDQQPRVINGAGHESPNGNSVSLETEMMKAAAVSGQHDRALAIYKSSLNILRSSLGRR